MLRNLIVTLVCFGAGIAPGIAEETAKSKEYWALTSSQMDRITAGYNNAASVVLGDNFVSATASHQNTNKSGSSSRATGELVAVGDGFILELSGDAKTIADVPSVDPAPPDPQVGTGYKNAALLALEALAITFPGR